jgi:hypothetical protein
MNPDLVPGSIWRSTPPPRARGGRRLMYVEARVECLYCGTTVIYSHKTTAYDGRRGYGDWSINDDDHQTVDEFLAAWRCVYVPDESYQATPSMAHEVAAVIGSLHIPRRPETNTPVVQPLDGQLPFVGITERYPVYFDRIITPRFTQDVQELQRTHGPAVRDQIVDAALADMEADNVLRAERTRTLPVIPMEIETIDLGRDEYDNPV